MLAIRNTFYLFFLKILFIYLSERERGARVSTSRQSGRQRQREKQAAC